MTAFLSSLTFLNPWLLSGLIFLPALWFLLRVVPPAPRHIYFPAARFLEGLKPDSRTSSNTPWWILLLRLLTIAFLIIALARPVSNPDEALPGSGAIRIVMDNGWESAQNWQDQINTAESLLNRAAREKRAVFFMTTAPEPGKDKPLSIGPAGAGEVESALRGLALLPWPADYKAAADLLEKSSYKESVRSYWLSAGLSGNGHETLVRRLQNQGALHFIMPETSNLPLLLAPGNTIGSNTNINIIAPAHLEKARDVVIQSYNNQGGLIDAQKVRFPANRLETPVELEIPTSIQNEISQIRLAGNNGAGGIIIFDDRNKRRHVGIATPRSESEIAPLIEDSYYLIRALEPYTDLQIAPLAELLDADPAVIVLPDTGALSSKELNNLESWVRNGGMLLRFAGPNMTQGEHFLTPVRLRKGGRALDGAMTWAEPSKLAPFPENSPLYGIDIREDITVNRQMLADPGIDIKDKAWAVLDDGTPLITADNLEDGILVLVHTTASPEWSNLALSGLYVEILRRIIRLSAGQVRNVSGMGPSLHPLLVLDGRGNLTQPESHVKPLPTDRFENMKPGPYYPPGLYGRTGYEQSFNLGGRIATPEAISSLPTGTVTAYYKTDNEKDLMPFFLLVALLLFMADWLIMLIMQISSRFSGGFARRRITGRPVLKSVLVTFAFIGGIALFAVPAAAQPENTTTLRYANDLHLAYIATDRPQENRRIEKGLENLSRTLTRRTSVEPAGVAALDPEKDDLVLFPFIYWPVFQNDAPLSDRATKNVQYYLDHGGMILFDLRAGTSGDTAYIAGNAGNNTLQNVTAGLDIPPLSPMPKDHVIGKSFYLLTDLPGRYRGRPIWITEASAQSGNRVSPVIIGSHDWAGAWALAERDSNNLPGGAHQYELSLRAGVNMIMYALTGNYKGDQVHLPHILERLGQ